MQPTQNLASEQPEKLPSEVLRVPPLTVVEDEPEKRRIVDQLLDLADCCEYWHDPSDTSYVTISQGDHRQHYRVESRSFEMWLRQQFYHQSGTGVPNESMKQAVATLNARALFNGEQFAAHLRTARDSEGNVWLDLCDDQWRAVRIAPGRWEIITNPPVRFVRQGGMRPLPAPAAGDIDLLWQLVHCDEKDRILVAGFLLNALHPEGPFFGLNIFGPKGSAKSTATRFIRSLIDPNEAFSQSMPGSAEDFALAAQGQRVLAFENLSKLSDAESDWLCRLSTGDAIRRRTLYANADETIFRAKRPWIINGIPDLVCRGDLIDRALSVELLAIDRSERREESAIIEEFTWPPRQVTHLRTMMEWFAAKLSETPARWLKNRADEVLTEARIASSRKQRIGRAGEMAEELAFLDSDETEKLGRYETTTHSALLRDTHELQRLQAMRLGMTSAIPLAVDVINDA